MASITYGAPAQAPAGRIGYSGNSNMLYDIAHSSQHVVVAHDRTEKLKSFILDKVNAGIEELRLGCERMNQLYNLDLDTYQEPLCTSLQRVALKAQLCRRAFVRVEAVLTRYQPSTPEIVKKKLPQNSAIEADVNPCLESLDEAVSEIEMRLININEKCQMNLKMEQPTDEPFKDLKQMIHVVVRKVLRIGAPWITAQIFIITNNIDLGSAPPELLEQTHRLKELFENELIDAQEFALRRLQILDKIFFIERKHDIQERRRFADNHNALQNVAFMYGERKVALPSHYDRGQASAEYEEEYANNEEALRLQLLTRGLEERMASQNDPRHRDTHAEVAESRYQAAAKMMEERNAGRPDPTLKYANPVQATLRPEQVAADAARRRAQFEREQAEATLRGKQVAANRPVPKEPAKPTFKSVPTSASEVEEYKRQMLLRYEQEQRENAELLRKKKEAGGN